MPILSFMEFANHSLRVKYRAAAEPQTLDVLVTVEAEPFAVYAPWAMTSIVESCNRGAAAGSLFAPSDCLMRVLSGPLTEQEAQAAGLHYAWKLEVASVAPEFIRLMVEELRRCGFDKRVVSMDIRGSLPLDDTVASVDEKSIRGWLNGIDAYPGVTPQLPFRYAPGPKHPDRHDVGFCVDLLDPVLPPVLEQLEELAVRWMNAVRNYASEDGAEVVVDLNITLPHCAAGGARFRALFQEFRHNARSADVLLNMLSRFHTTVAPIVAAEISI